MDIIVTTPKSRMADAAQEARDAREAIEAGGESWYFRNLGPYGRPAITREGDRIYYVEDGYVRGFATIAAITRKPEMVCGTTGRWFGPGWYVVMDSRSWRWIEPIPMRGFQGWRYFDSLEHDVTVIGGWRDPKPEVA